MFPCYRVLAFAKHHSVIALSKLYDLKDPRLAGVQVKGDLIPNTDGRIMTRSRARISKHQHLRFSSPSSFERTFNQLQHQSCSECEWTDKHESVPTWSFLSSALLPFSAAFAQASMKKHNLTDPFADPDQYNIVPATLKILKVLIVELQSASGAADLDAAAAADLAEENEDDDDWEDEPNSFLDLGSGLSREQLMAYAAEDGPGIGRQKDDETQAFLVDFFKRAANTQGFREEFEALTEEERQRLQESAA